MWEWDPPDPTVVLWVDDHQEFEPGIVTAHLRHARLPLDPHPGDYLVVGDDEVHCEAYSVSVMRPASGSTQNPRSRSDRSAAR